MMALGELDSHLQEVAIFNMACSQVYALASALTSGISLTLVRLLGTTQPMPFQNVCWVQAAGQV